MKYRSSLCRQAVCTASDIFTNIVITVPWPIPQLVPSRSLSKKLYNTVKNYVTLIGVKRFEKLPFYRKFPLKNGVGECYGDRSVFAYGVRVIYRLYCSNRHFWGDAAVLFLFLRSHFILWRVNRGRPCMRYLLIIFGVNDEVDRVM